MFASTIQLMAQQLKCTEAQVRKQLLRNAAQLRAMATKANDSPDKLCNGYGWAELTAKADKLEQTAHSV